MAQGILPAGYLPAGLFPAGYFGGAGSAPPAVAPTAAIPNPAETAWTLDVGGAVVTPSAAAGFDYLIATTLKNAGLAVSYDDGAATLDAKVWRGGGGSPLFAPTVAWIDSTLGTLTLAVAASQTATLDPGTYRLQVGVTAAGARVVAFDGGLEVTDAPGSGSAPMSWCSYADMLLYSDQVAALVPRKSGSALFLSERANATARLMRWLVVRYDPRPGFIRVRNPGFDRTLGYDAPDPSAVAPTKAELTAALAAGGLILEEKAREAVARMAIALVLDRQATSANGSAYRREADDHRARAEMILKGYQAEVDSDLDGTPDYLVDTDVILLPAGAAP